MTDKKDGRRNNRTPDHSKIRRFEVRNPHGRGGKPPPATPPNKIDDMYLEESERIVSQDENGPVSAARRLVQEEYHDALKNRDPAARARVIDQVARSADRQKQHELETLGWLIERKAEVSDAFHNAKMSGRPAPNILPHPAHVDLERKVFVGPMTWEIRDWWEDHKRLLQGMALLHELLRYYNRSLSSDKTARQLKAVEAARRRLMRRVPKGWNWQENIYSRGGDPKLLAEQLLVLKALKHEIQEVDNEAED